MALLKAPSTAPSSSDIRDQIAHLMKEGWKITADGPSGVQLTAPKKMRVSGKGLMIVGAVLFVIVLPAGILCWMAAGFDYFFFTKSEIRFIPR